MNFYTLNSTQVTHRNFFLKQTQFQARDVETQLPSGTVTEYNQTAYPNCVLKTHTFSYAYIVK